MAGRRHKWFLERRENKLKKKSQTLSVPCIPILKIKTPIKKVKIVQIFFYIYLELYLTAVLLPSYLLF